MGPKAAGVMLTLRADFAGGRTDITEDTDGRAMSANIYLGDDSTARMNGTYGVSGACCPNFTSFTNKRKAEAKLNYYITTQTRTCYEKAYHMVVAGDMNSYTQPSLV